MSTPEDADEQAPVLDLAAAERALASLTDDQASEVDKQLWERALHMSDRIHYAEGRRGSFATIGGALAAFGTAILSLVSFGNASKQPTILVVAMVVIGVSAVLAGIIIWFAYSRQTNFEYSFKGISGPNTWFYRDAIAGSRDFEIPWNTYLATNEEAAASNSTTKRRTSYINDWPGFAEAQIETLSQPKARALENLRQVYLLHYNEYYKNKFLSHLRTLTGVLVAFMAVEIVVFAVLAIFNV